VYESLKPGGVFIVEDHSAKAGAPADVTYTLHRIEEDVAKREFVSAGFRIAGASNVLRDASDDRRTLSLSGGTHDHLWVHVFRYVALSLLVAQREGYAISDKVLNVVVSGDLSGAVLALAGIIFLRVRSRLGPIFAASVSLRR
jgi:hypothetical protein